MIVINYYSNKTNLFPINNQLNNEKTNNKQTIFLRDTTFFYSFTC